MVAIVKSSWTAREYEKTIRHPGRKGRQVAGAWIDDLASLRKAICLCDQCKRRFFPASYRYKRVQAVPGYNYVKGQCDGCKAMTDCNTFFPTERAT